MTINNKNIYFLTNSRTRKIRDWSVHWTCSFVPTKKGMNVEQTRYWRWNMGLQYITHLSNQQLTHSLSRQGQSQTNKCFQTTKYGNCVLGLARCFLVEFMPRGTAINLDSYCANLKNLWPEEKSKTKGVALCECFKTNKGMLSL